MSNVQIPSFFCTVDYRKFKVESCAMKLMADCTINHNPLQASNYILRKLDWDLPTEELGAIPIK